ncbi:unnamed protein product [Leptosia nina]|uniref:Uncharacterized protein n=1 Tax=Leptosia nina TaxID=320188 RepID=A0AAV1J024_9NEOP
MPIGNVRTDTTVTSLRPTDPLATHSVPTHSGQREFRIARTTRPNSDIIVARLTKNVTCSYDRLAFLQSLQPNILLMVTVTDKSDSARAHIHLALTLFLITDDVAPFGVSDCVQLFRGTFVSTLPFGKKTPFCLMSPETYPLLSPRRRVSREALMSAAFVGFSAMLLNRLLSARHDFLRWPMITISAPRSGMRNSKEIIRNVIMRC